MDQPDDSRTSKTFIRARVQASLRMPRLSIQLWCNVSPPASIRSMSCKCCSSCNTHSCNNSGLISERSTNNGEPSLKRQTAAALSRGRSTASPASQRIANAGSVNPPDDPDHFPRARNFSKPSARALKCANVITLNGSGPWGRRHTDETWRPPATSPPINR